MRKRSGPSILFTVINYLFLTCIGFACLLPMVHVLAVSLSSNSAASAGFVTLFPVDFTLASYRFVLAKPEFLQSIGVTLQRVLFGFLVNMLITVLAAYPLSMDTRKFKMRTAYAWFFLFTTFFSGGLIPLYMVVKQTGLLDSIWALVLPSAVPVFSIILLLNFFRQLPNELFESASIDGAGYFRILFQIYIPVSLPALATITLLCVVGHWNSWFDGLIFMNRPENYPLQSYMQTILVSPTFYNVNAEDLKNMQLVSDRTTKSAQIFIGALPIIAVYPFLQKYFMKGIVLGSVKG